MVEIMSYQYPPPGTPPPPYDADYPVPTQPTGMGMRSPGQGQPGRTGHDSSAALSFDLKRSPSYPNLKMEQNPGFDDKKMVTSGEKKRGRLNYHRAATACSACRQRKIRCQAGSPGQPKCAQCERLNKDCKFEAVNHDRTATRHTSVSSRTGQKLVTVSNSSSPAIASGHPHHQQHMAMHPAQAMVLGDPPDLNKMPRVYTDYGSQGMAGPAWITTDTATGGGVGNTSAATSSSSAHAHDAKHASWGPYSNDSTPVAATFPAYAHTTPPPTAGWPPPSHHHQHQQAGDASASNSPWANYPPPHQSSFSPQAYQHSQDPRRSMPPAEMYPPVPGMDGVGAQSTPTGVTAAGGWPTQQAQAYPSSLRPGDGYAAAATAVGAGGWYSSGEPGMAPSHHQMGQHQLPIGEGYYTPR